MSLIAVTAGETYKPKIKDILIFHSEKAWMDLENKLVHHGRSFKSFKFLILLFFSYEHDQVM